MVVTRNGIEQASLDSNHAGFRCAVPTNWPADRALPHGPYQTISDERANCTRPKTVWRSEEPLPSERGRRLLRDARFWASRCCRWSGSIQLRPANHWCVSNLWRCWI